MYILIFGSTSLTQLNYQHSLMKSPAKGILRWFFGDALKELEVSSVPNPYDTPLYWLVNRDPYNGLLKSLYNIYITGSYNPLYKTTNRGFEHCSGDILESGLVVQKNFRDKTPGASGDPTDCYCRHLIGKT